LGSLPIALFCDDVAVESSGVATSHHSEGNQLITRISGLGALFAAVMIPTFVLAGCATSPTSGSATAYLKSLEDAHQNDSKAKKVCVRSAGTPTKIPLVAVNSTLKLLRKLETPALLARTDDSMLTSDKQGYAAICLFVFTDFGKPTKTWTFALPTGDSDFIDTK
jgi:hypothetical protein